MFKAVGKYIWLWILLLWIVSSCGSYYKVSRYKTNEQKWEGANQLYGQKKYLQSATLFSELLPVLKGTSREEECLYLLAQSYYKQNDFESSGHYFRRYYSSYPAGSHVSEAVYYCGYGYYLSSPNYELDQSATTMRALEEFNLFLEYFPEHEKAQEVQGLIDEMNNKLAYKQYKTAELYYNLGDYLGNNYLSCVVTAKNTLNDYPYTKHREELYILILRARFQEAHRSVETKKQERYRNVIDEFYNYKNEYPEGKYLNEATRYYKIAQAYTHSDEGEYSKLLKEEKNKKVKNTLK
ncbi:MAG TPA: outer membrane protein assembly factor BamD [Porphyromonadaceae bacterium]|nr:outer membrane protein assembly factor BamD [Porphyromonadaceae bacterium]